MEDITTLVCLYHHESAAHAAVGDLAAAGIPRPAITTIAKNGSASAASSLEALGVPERDRQHLMEGIQAGGVVVAVAAISENVARAEAIFQHGTKKIDEKVVQPDAAPIAAPVPVAAAAMAGETVIPIVEEELVVGKRAVQRGGVRVYRRMVDTPVEQSVNLREEHVTVDRQPVNRAVTEGDLATAGDRTIELTETAEVAVVGKTAQVVEEVRIGKEATEHAERVHDMVRRTEVDVEQVAATGQSLTGDRTVTRSGL